MNAVILSARRSRSCWLSDEWFPRDHRHQPAASLANRRARRDRVGHPLLMPNCTNWLVSCPATLHRKVGCPVHKLARSWLPSLPGGFLIFCVWLGAGWELLPRRVLTFRELWRPEQNFALAGESSASISSRSARSVSSCDRTSANSWLRVSTLTSELHKSICNRWFSARTVYISGKTSLSGWCASLVASVSKSGAAVPINGCRVRVSRFHKWLLSLSNHFYKRVSNARRESPLSPRTGWIASRGVTPGAPWATVTTHSP